MPNTEREWLTNEHGFKNRFPHAVAAIDGKLVVLQAPNNNGSEKVLDIVLLALIDSNHCFMFANIGSELRTRDGDILKNSDLLNRMENNMLKLPTPTPLQNGHINLPYVFLGDDAFSLNNTIMIPYPGEHQEGTKELIFNTKVLSSRAVVENTYGVITSVFRVLRKPILLLPEHATKVIMACVVLHNFMRKSTNSSTLYTPPGTFDTFDGDTLVSKGSWRNDIPDHPALHNMCNIQTSWSEKGVEIRNQFANEFYQC